MKRSGVLVVMLLLPAVAFATPAEAGDIALPERLLPGLNPYLQNAISQSPALLNRNIDLEIAENSRIGARAGLLPSLTADYRAVQARDDRADVSTTLSVHKIFYDVTLTQPLFHWGERRNNYRMSLIRQKLAGRQFGEAYRMVAGEIRGLYLRLIVQKLRVERYRLERDFAAATLREAEAGLAAGLISANDVIGPRLRAESTQIDFERTGIDMENARRSFAHLTGTPTIPDEELPDAVPELADDLAPYERILADFLKLEEPPALSAFAARQEIEIERLNLQNQRTRLRPKFNLVAGFTQDEHSYTLNTAQRFAVNSTYVGFSMRWQIFDGFAARSAVRNSLALLRQKENTYKQQVQDLAAQAQAQKQQIYYAARNMSVRDRQLALAHKRQAEREEQLRHGQISANDVKYASFGLLDARMEAYNARIDFLARIAEFLGTVNQDPVTARLPPLP